MLSKLSFHDPAYKGTSTQKIESGGFRRGGLLVIIRVKEGEAKESDEELLWRMVEGRWTTSLFRNCIGRNAQLRSTAPAVALCDLVAPPPHPLVECPY